jgi:tRNA modification GTPase
MKQVSPLQDTIAAIATPAGVGGVGIVRVSGPLAEEVAHKIFRPRRDVSQFKSHRLYYGHIIDAETQEVIDEVLIALMRAPHSYTGEDVLEIYAHGGPLILRHILELCLKAGARLAEPGEFTKRAFLNGRLDLTQAEAVLQVINAKTEQELKIATKQLQGYLGEKIEGIRKCLIEFKAHLEVAIDFPEEDIEIVPPKVWLPRIEKEVIAPIKQLLLAYEHGRVLREGALMAIVGRPNVGKSSLLNRLLREERAIVTPIPGTTRDVIEEMLNIKGIPIRIADTAGLRKTTDAVEAIGVERAKKKIAEADVILWVVDISQALTEEDREIYQEIAGKNVILVLNKCDLPAKVDVASEFENLPTVKISALYGQGIEELEEIIYNLLIGEGKERVVSFVPSLRHKKALEKAFSAVLRIKETIEKGLPPVFISVDVQEALDYLGEIIGETTPEEVLNYIFSQFCIGK